MRRNRAVLHILSSIAVLATSACSSAPTMVAPNPGPHYEVLGKTHASACGFALFGFIPIGMNSRTERAYAAALKKGGTGLINTELQTQWWVIPLIGHIHCTQIRGTEVRS